MTYFGYDWRHRRNFLNPGMPFGTMHHTIANYTTDTDLNKKPDIEVFEKTMFSKIQSIPDPLKKNLADTVITHSKQTPRSPTEDKEFIFETNIGPVMSDTVAGPSGHRRNVYSPFSGLTSFITNVFGSISEVMFQRKTRSPVSQYYDCYDSDSQLAQEMAAESWQASRFDDENKKSSQEQSGIVNDDMNNCRAAVAQVEDKISAVRDLLTNKTVPNVAKTTRVRYRRPRRAFVEAGSVSDSYEEDTPDSYVSLANDDYIEYIAVPNQIQNYCNIEAAEMKTKVGIVPEPTDIVKILQDDNVIEKAEIPTVIDVKPTDVEVKKEVIIASCEDKLAKLKAMLLERKKPTRQIPPEDTIPDPEPEKQDLQKPVAKTKVIPIQKTHDKRFKNPCRLTSKRRKTKQRKNIQNDMVFANEIDSDDVSSLENSPAVSLLMQKLPEKLSVAVNHTDNDYFDETKGKFHSASTDSDDSFQIVFSESPKMTRMRRPSDCDSEDSFIVFEESPNSCFTSNHLFEEQSSDDDSDSDMSDEESDVNDSGCPDVCKLSHSLSRTVSDLSDNSLFDDCKSLEKTSVIEEINTDEVDCAVRSVDSVVCKELSPVKEESPEVESDHDDTESGLLITEAKKLKRKGQPRKSVSFSSQPPKVHVMRVWSFAARQARAGHWERFSLDRERFKRRIADVDMAISWVLKPQHRSRIMFQRFMPWWNKQKRIEAAEKKLREEEERIRKEEERLKRERESIIEEELKQEIDEINKYYDALANHMNAIMKDERTEKKLRAIQDLKDSLMKDKKKMARKKERERKMESELSKSPISAGSNLPNRILPMC